ncbi:MAG: helix-turn-helix domain-containing protein [Haliscomenobacter sp.]|nr:helix-turn-helix transcriptional regulator [Haliscomenobacter sp.]MBK9490704.1 helix-turn-helix domain-containing protein [Haliscomenobacter sp.]
MSTKAQNERILFGLKVKQLRQQLSLSFADLSEKAGMSVSYLNEIEKGKKYPKGEKIQTLARALNVSAIDLTSQEVDEGLAPIHDLLQSNFLNELPLERFGIDLAKVVEIIAGAPSRVGAFISTLLELSRNYALRQEHFYFSALRSYLELNNNYFEELENAVDKFVAECQLLAIRPIPGEHLRNILEEKYDYIVHENGLDRYPELQHLRSLFIPKRKELLLSSKLSAIQRAFEYGKELGFQYLNIKERAYTSSILRGRSFEEVLSHSKAIYFSVALHLPLQSVIQDMEFFFQHKEWNGEALQNIMLKYDATPEMFYHRLTNVLPRFFGIRKMFFLRFVHDPIKGTFDVDKELHLNHKHHPHGNGIYEHYCRRWISIALLQELFQLKQAGRPSDLLIGAQISHYLNTTDQYLCFTVARPSYPSPNKNVSVTIGLLIDDELRAKVHFLNDPAIPARDVHTTCERCSIEDCVERAAEPSIVQKKQQFQQIQDRLNKLLS